MYNWFIILELNYIHMAYLAVDKDGDEWVYEEYPERHYSVWDSYTHRVELPKGSIAKLIGRELTWEDEPVELE